MTREEAQQKLEKQLDMLEAGVASGQCTIRFALAQASLASNECLCAVLRAAMIDRSMAEPSRG